MSGIAPALRDGPRALTESLINAACQLQIPIWFDVNYRRKLWDEATAREILLPFVEKCDTVLAGVSEAQMILETDETRPEILAQLLRELGPKIAVVKCGTSGTLWQDKNDEA